MQTPNSSHPFYVVSMGKFTVLFLATLGNYSLYWFYKNWVYIGQHQQRNTYPLLRTVFFIFFIPQLCYELAKYQTTQNQSYPWSPAFVSGGYIASSLCVLFTTMGVTQGHLSGGWLWLQFPAVFFQYYLVYKFQLVANRACADAFGKTNAQFSILNHVWITVGIFFWFDQLRIVYLVSTGQLDLANI